ncbi:hypothetical protein [Rubritalea tangerina]|uniref:hypothetical protein n=1 Tax=Rubritalea tangerina TaxID=430798 RepID=UPI00361D301F
MRFGADSDLLGWLVLDLVSAKLFWEFTSESDLGCIDLKDTMFFKHGLVEHGEVEVRRVFKLWVCDFRVWA